MQWAREKECSSRDENTSKSSQSRWVYQAGVRNGVKEKEAKKKGSIRWSDSAKKTEWKTRVENSAMQRAGEEKLFRLVVMPVHLHYVCLVGRWLSGIKVKERKNENWRRDRSNLGPSEEKWPSKRSKRREGEEKKKNKVNRRLGARYYSTWRRRHTRLDRNRK